MLATIIERGLYAVSALMWGAVFVDTTRETLAAALLLSTLVILTTIIKQVVA